MPTYFVCGGLAKYFELDPTLVRVIFVALALLGGPGVLLYIILWAVVPPEPTTGEKAESAGEMIAGEE